MKAHQVSEFLAQQPTKGFMPREEGEALFNTILMQKSASPALEIGTYCGKSTTYLGMACQHMHRCLYTVDHHRGSEEHQEGEGYFDPELCDDSGRFYTLPSFMRAMLRADLLETVIPIIGSSQRVWKHWNTSLGLVFIDGGHSFEQAFFDIGHWAQHIEPGGLMLIHDIYPEESMEGDAPRKALELFQQQENWRQESLVGSLTLLKKPSA